MRRIANDEWSDREMFVNTVTSRRQHDVRPTDMKKMYEDNAGSTQITTLTCYSHDLYYTCSVKYEYNMDNYWPRLPFISTKYHSLVR